MRMAYLGFHVTKFLIIVILMLNVIILMKNVLI